jgi:hydroxymethylpyrimidine pyrophosphatase-like HAD family hydrolase
LFYLEEHTKVKDVETVYMFFTNDHYDPSIIDPIMEELSKLPNLTVHKSGHKYPGKFGLNITHVAATKAHGLEIVMKQLGIKKEEVIAAGDGYNDFPLLMAAGLKVAMGNAVDDLKAIADYIAPRVEEDGIADVIEKFIFPKS